MPLLVTAGDYAAKIQSSVRSQPSKSYETPFSQALTDADLSVQSFIEVAMLARYPEVQFFGEEVEQSLNSKYFPVKASYKACLDPIDGTLFYKHGLDRYHIILTLSDNDTVLTSIVYMPRLKLFYFSVAGKGAYKVTSGEALDGSPWNRHTLPAGTDRIMVYNDLALRKALSQFDLMDLSLLKDPHEWTATISNIFEGDIGGFVKFNAPLLDWGAFGEIVREAGGVCTDISGQKLPHYYDSPSLCVPSLVCARNVELHERLLAALAKNY